MNLNFFGLRQTPFGEVDSSSLFWTPKRRELATQFRHILTQRQGMVVLTGEDGSGKTTFIRGVLDGLAPQPVKVITLSSEKLSFPMLLKTLLRELSETVPLGDALPDTAIAQTPQAPAHPLAPLENIAPLIRTLHAALLAHHTHQGSVVLVIDNAHQLPVQTLKDFHWLSLLETPEGKLLQTIFVGNATLSLKLEMPQLHALQRRIAASGELAPLTLEESFVYLLTRLRAKLGVRPASPVFSVEALRLLARHGKGNPRSLNALATAALRAGATRRQKPISGQLTLEVIAELRTLPMMNRMNRSDRRPASISLPANFRRRPTPQATAHPLRAASIGAIAAALLLALSYYGSKNGWLSTLPNPVKLFRNDTVAQAAPGTEAAATLPVSNFIDSARFPEIDKPEQNVQPPPPKEKKQELSGVRGQSDENVKPLSSSSRSKDKRKKRPEKQLQKGTSPLDNKGEIGTLENALPGKILYKVPLDPASNSDRLFDD